MTNLVPTGTHLAGDGEVSTLMRNDRSNAMNRLILAATTPGRLLYAALAAMFAPLVASGTATLVGGTITVANASITAASQIRVFQQTPGANAGAPYVSSLTPGTGFTIKSTNASDTSVVRYEVAVY